MERKYFTIDFEKGQEEKFKKFMKKENINHKEFETALQLFCWEEARYRIECYASDKSDEEIDKLIKENQEALSDKLYDDDYLINGDAAYDDTKDIIINGPQIGRCAKCCADLHQKDKVLNKNDEYECPVCGSINHIF